MAVSIVCAADTDSSSSDDNESDDAKAGPVNALKVYNGLVTFK